MYLTNEWYVEAAADAKRRNSESTVFLEILTSRLHANMHYSAARMLAESKVDRYIKTIGPPECPDLVREHLIAWGVREEGNKSPLLPPEARLFKDRYPSHLAEIERKKGEREKWERIANESRAAAERTAHQTWLMKDMREWGRENGYVVGTRGRIPSEVINAYREAKGL
ncbi:Lsr2 family protein [Streptomyces sp. NBC_00440]|uniref:Lsr2 family DNA-binding protein n=1 Tax=Streptomyces sp. NBC_00440 TaxID=2975741 RepID=UPI002E1EC459